MEGSIHIVKKYFLNNLVLITVLIIGVAVRIYKFGQIPSGLNQDEASTAYDAFSILHYGIDRHGFHNPVIFEAWGSGVNALYSYLSMPFIYFFGLSTFSAGLVNLTFGVLSLAMFYLLIKKISNNEVALLSAFLLAISPWHIMLSRWGLDSNIFPAFFLLGVYFFVSSFDNKKYFLLSFTFFALSLYAYNTAYFVVPIFILFSVLFSFCHKKIKISDIAVPLLVFVILSLPIYLYVAINIFKLDSIITPLFSIPRFSGVSRFQTSFLDKIHKPGFFFENLKVLWNILKTQDDGLVWNSAGGFGYMYKISGFFALIGLITNLAIIAKNRMRSFNKVFFILLWLAVSVALGVVMEANINRINIIFLPMIFLTASGIYYLADFINSRFLSGKSLKSLLLIIVIIYMMNFGFFVKFYFTDYQKIIGPVFYESFGEAINYAEKIRGTAPVCVTPPINMPYISVLFYTKAPVDIFLRTVKYANPGAEFQWVASFSDYNFKREECSSEKKYVYIISNSETSSFRGKNIKMFKYYSVVY